MDLSCHLGSPCFPVVLHVREVVYHLHLGRNYWFTSSGGQRCGLSHWWENSIRCLLVVAAVEARLLRIGSGACGLALEEDFQKENLVEKGKYLVRRLGSENKGGSVLGRCKTGLRVSLEEVWKRRRATCGACCRVSTLALIALKSMQTR